jgi:hypothetical protein
MPLTVPGPTTFPAAPPGCATGLADLARAMEAATGAIDQLRQVVDQLHDAVRAEREPPEDLIRLERAVRDLIRELREGRARQTHERQVLLAGLRTQLRADMQEELGALRGIVSGLPGILQAALAIDPVEGGEDGQSTLPPRA